MNNSDLDNYALLLRKRREVEILLQHQREDLRGCELSLTPTGDDYKSLGSNDSDRKNVLEKVYAKNAVHAEITQKIRALEIELSNVNAEIDDYEARRRNDEWITTRMLAEALHERFVSRNPAPTASTATAIAEAQGDAALEVMETISYDDYSIDDSIPF
jgi:hypothetical protein